MPATKIHANFQRISGGRGAPCVWVIVATAAVRLILDAVASSEFSETALVEHDFAEAVIIGQN